MKRTCLCILVLAALLMPACSGKEEPAAPTMIPATEKEEPTPVLYNLMADVYPEEGGLVYPAEKEVVDGTSIEVQAIPVPGYGFEGWSGADSSTNPNLTLVMDGDRQLTAHFILLATPTPVATPTPTPSPHKDPAEVTLDDLETSVAVCGVVTNFGLMECETCPHRVFSFIKLDQQFLIASYEWLFNVDWKGAGLCLTDTVEEYAGKPAFFLDKEEGEAGVECFYEGYISGLTWQNEPIPGEELHCPPGDYFQPCPTCEEAHFTLPDLVWTPSRSFDAIFNYDHFLQYGDY